MEKLKHWQLFLIFFVPFFVALHIDDVFYDGILQSLSLGFIICYFLAIGEFLHRIKKSKAQTFFRINCFYLIFFIFLFGHIGKLVSEEFMLIGVAGLIYAHIAIVQVLGHVALLVRQNESKPVDNYQHKAECMLLFFWPIGIWFLQPRINRICERLHSC